MARLIYHPAGRFESVESPERFDVIFTRGEIRALTWDMEDDVNRVLKPAAPLTRIPPDVADAAFITETNAEDERFTHSQRFHFSRYRLRSLVEVLR